MTVRVVTDSTADLPSGLARELGITVVPAYVGFGGRTFRDGVDISHDELYQKLEAGDVLPTTSQPTPTDFADTYRKLLGDTDEIASVHVSGKLSGTYSSALGGREMLGEERRIKVVDSQSLSMGLGLIAIAAARLAKTGASLPRVMREITQSVPKIHLWGVLDTLKYMLLGGRIGRAKALLGSLLNVKPMLTLRDGEFRPDGLARTRTMGLKRLINHLRDYPDTEDVAIVHSTTPDEAQKLKQQIGPIFTRNPILISRLGPALGVHGGPGTLILVLRDGTGRLRQEASV